MPYGTHITNPHDKFFREILTREEVARDFVYHYLPEEINKRSLTPSPHYASVITEEEVVQLKTFNDLKLGTNEKEAIQEATRILRKRFPVENVILFGSKARGDSDPESDIDLLLLTTKPLNWKERHEIVDALFDLEMKHDVVISIIVNTLRDWNEGVCTLLPIHDEISGEGVGLQ